MDIAGWRVWFTDGAVLSSADTAWVDLPDTGVVGVVVYYDAFAGGSGTRYRRVLDGGDWYWPFGQSGTNDEPGVWVDPPDDVDPALLRRGKWVSDLTFDIYSQQMRDSRWP